jgi:sugar lactone lactonase YvrE/predicted Fe-Mo cluster-binding NifX family protein
MKFFLLTIHLLIMSVVSFSQNGINDYFNKMDKNAKTTQISLFSVSRTSLSVIPTNAFKEGYSPVLLNLNTNALTQIDSKTNSMTLLVPLSGETNLELELFAVNIFAPDFKVIDAKGKEVSYTKGLNFHGRIKGKEKSIAAVSIANGEISAIISDKTGTRTLGKLKDSNIYSLHYDDGLVKTNPFTCQTEDGIIINNNTPEPANLLGCKSVGIYLEADNATYAAKGSSIQNTTDYIVGLMAQVNILFRNENLAFYLTQIKVWNTADPYVSASDTRTALTLFRNNVGNTFTGNLSHLISTRPLGGGIAYLNALCNKSVGHAVSAINNSYSPVPTYSWSVTVLAHELGHNFGSNHTQWCGWLGGALDNCYTTEGGCEAGPAPTNGGTIMSYCHLTSYGINLANGFGTQPGNRIRNQVNECSEIGVINSPVQVLSSNSIAVTSAVVTWEFHNTSSSYTLAYRRVGEVNFTTINTTNNFYTLTQLYSGVQYEWKVLGDCSNAYSSSGFFTTQGNTNIPPSITGFSPTSAKPGDVVTLMGTNFNTTPNNNIVFFGATRASVTAASNTSITVTVPSGATYAPITLLNTGTSLAASSLRNFTPTYSPAKTSLTATDFQAKQDFATGSFPEYISIGDLDGDGRPDLVVANSGSNTFSVYRNTSSSGSIGAGSFAAKVDFATGSEPKSIAIGDLDGDGRPDLVVANSGSNIVSVYRNTSSSGSISAGSFAAKVDFVTGSFPSSVAIDDLDGDGKLDLIVANAGSNTVSVFRNTASISSIVSGSFAAKVDFATGSFPRSVAIGDLDGDGKLDLIVANAGSNTVSVFRNTASSSSIVLGSFATKVDFATGTSPYSVAIGDLDGDDKPDLIVANLNSKTVSVIRNTSTSGSIVSGSFATNIDFATGSFPRSVAIGDLDGDSKLDLVISNIASNIAYNTVSVIRNISIKGSINSDSFAAKVDLASGDNSPSVAIGDLDGDGKPDLAVVNYGSNTVSILRNADTRVLLNLPNSTLFEGQESIQLTVSLSSPSSQNVSANLSFSGSAILGTDYTVDKQTVNFVPGNTVEIVTITAINDNLVEILESIQIQVIGGTNILAPYPSITAYLSSEDKPTASLSLDKTSIIEAGGIATLTATLTAPTSQAVTIALKPTGNATNRVDYEANFVGKDATTTVAGGRSAANQFDYPSGIFIDNNGNIFVADRSNHRIQKWGLGATEGITVAGGNGEGSAANQLSSPWGVYVDNNGNVFVADLSNNRIQKWTPGATQGITVAGGNGYGTAANKLSGPSSVYVDSNGNIFIADTDSHRIQKWVPGATEGITVAGGNGIGSASNQLNYPSGVHIDSNGNVFVADRNNHRIQKWVQGATEGITVAGGNDYGSAVNQLNSPRSVYVDSNGNIFVADFGNHRIQKWTPGAIQGITVAGGNDYGSAANQLSFPLGVFLNSYGNIFVADGTNHRIQKWTPGATEVVTVAGGNYRSANNQLWYPYDVFVDSYGNIFVADANNNRIQKWVLGSTQVITVAGGNGQGSASNQLSNPTDVYVDSYGNIFVADMGNHRIQKWIPGATQGITVAGGNGQGSAANQLNYPNGVYVDSNGNIFVSDGSNNRIQKWMPGAAQGITVAGGNGGGSAANQLSNPTDVYADSNGNIFIADLSNHRIQKWMPGNTQGITVAGGNGPGSAANQLSNPYGVYVDSNGNIFIADLSNHRIQKWMPGNTQGITVAGGNGYGGAANQFRRPYGFYVDSNGNIFVADTYNNRIQKVQYQPQIVIPAGQTSGTASFSAINDLTFEGNETIVLEMDIIANATISPTQQALNLTIIDDEISPITVGAGRCGTGTVTLSATSCAGTYNWYATSTGGSSLGTGSSFTTPSISNTTTYYVDCTINDSKSLSRSAAIATINTSPAQPGVFTASSPVVCQGFSKTYSIASVADASGYLWSYSGSGVSITGSTTSVSLTYGTSATSGVLSVKSVGACGNSAERTMNVTVIPQQKVINGVIANGTRHIHQASKSILLNPTMSTPIFMNAGTVFIAEIVSCPN